MLIRSTSTQTHWLQSASHLAQPTTLPPSRPSLQTEQQSAGRLLASCPCHIRKALDFLHMPRSFLQCVFSRSVPQIIYTNTKESLCACSVTTSPASLGIWQAVPLTTPMEITAKQAVSQIPLKQFLEGSTSRETQMCGRLTDLDYQWLNFSVAWGSLHYRKCLPGDKEMILHYLF